jgi:hypothetical protein
MSAAHGLRAYLVSASVIGAILGGTHGHIQRKQRLPDITPVEELLCVSRDAMIGACVYPLYIPVMPLHVMYADKQFCPLR